METDRQMYSKALIIRTGHWAVLAVHSMYCRTGIRTGTYVRIIGTLEYKFYIFMKPG